MQIDLHLCLTDFECFSYLLIGFAFDVPQKHDGALHLRQVVHELSNERDLLACLQLSMRRLVTKMCHFIEIFGISTSSFHDVESTISASRYCERFEIVYLLPFIAMLPHFQECILHHIFGLCPIHRNAKSKAKEPVAQRQNGGSEADVFHLSTYEDDSGLQKLQP